MNPQRILFEQFKFLPVPVRRWAASAQDIQPVAAKSAAAHAAAAKTAA